ncbi:MAG TPA: hypothetical protein VF185_00055 [Patescibacteria group bacterium]
MKYPARPSRLAAKKNPPKKKNFGRWILLALIVLLIVAIIYILFGPHIWDAKSRLSIALQKKNGDVEVVTLDPSSSSITTINIPATTQVSASRDLGTWKLGSIQKLGINEKLDGGSFLASSITKSFKFPVEAWGDESMDSLSFFSLFRQTSTNLHLKDKIAIALFSFGIKSASRVDINLANTGYIVGAKLPDGTNGYEISLNIPVKVSSVFTDALISKRGVNVVIVDKMQSDFVSGRVGEIIEVLGAKISSIEKEDALPIDCIVAGNDPIVGKLANLFKCKVEAKKLNSNVEAEITLGQNFKKRF